MSVRRLACAACALSGLLVLPGCGSDRDGYASVPELGGRKLEGPPRTNVSLEMRDIEFRPRRVDLARGATVTWVNRDQVAHDVTQGSVVYNEFSSPDVEPGQTYRRTFDEPGVVRYRCTIHANMEGELRVE
jgi:plastocyanin